MACAVFTPIKTFEAIWKEKEKRIKNSEQNFQSPIHPSYLSEISKIRYKGLRFSNCKDDVIDLSLCQKCGWGQLVLVNGASYFNHLSTLSTHNNNININ